MKLKFLSKIDFFLVATTIVLSVVGILFIYSSGVNSDGIYSDKFNLYIKQMTWLGVGFIAMMVFNFIDYRKIERYAVIPYAIFSVLLVIVLLVIQDDQKVNGAKSWIKIGGFSFQPSEFMKIALILFLARYLDKSQNEKPLKRYVIAIAIISLPTLLTLVQPDMGTASVYIAIFFFMCFIADIPTRYILFLLFMGILTIFFTVLPTWEKEIYKKSVPIIHVLTNKKMLFMVAGVCSIVSIIGIVGRFWVKSKVYYWISYVFGILALAFLLTIPAGKVLKEYQLQRLIIFLDPMIDPENSGWHIIQSKIAIGSGSFFGRGYLKGSQSHLQYLSEQSTDFIFGIIAEEVGFFGCFLIMSVYIAMLVKIFRIARKVSNKYGILICSGVLGMLIFHFVINIGMVMGVMPITGIPLPFVSYGGTSLVINMISIGLVMSVRARRLDFDLPV